MGNMDYYYSMWYIITYKIDPELLDFWLKNGLFSISSGAALFHPSPHGVENAAFFLNGVSKVLD